MYSLIKELGVKGTLTKELPYLLLALITAEMFYKWHSFTRELIGFMVTWAVLSFIGNTIVNRVLQPQQAS